MASIHSETGYAMPRRLAGGRVRRRAAIARTMRRGSTGRVSACRNADQARRGASPDRAAWVRAPRARAGLWTARPRKGSRSFLSAKSSFPTSSARRRISGTGVSRIGSGLLSVETEKTCGACESAAASPLRVFHLGAAGRSARIVSSTSKVNATPWVDSQCNRLRRSCALASSRSPGTRASQG
jgi:hypothetical protein